MAVSNAQKETFLKLLAQIKTQVTLLNKQNRELKRENLKLSSKLDELKKKQSDVFSEISESERIAMRHRVSSMIDKINSHLDS